MNNTTVYINNASVVTAFNYTYIARKTFPIANNNATKLSVNVVKINFYRNITQKKLSDNCSYHYNCN